MSNLEKLRRESIMALQAGWDVCQNHDRSCIIRFVHHYDVFFFNQWVLTKLEFETIASFFLR
jgi:hypothetical protein